MNPVPKGRLRSLDVFRGATIAGMILVNNAGDWRRTFAPLLHAEWHGWTPTDLVFPFFLFAIGVATPFSFAGRLARAGGEQAPLYRQIARRSATLFALGLVLNWFPFTTVEWSTARIPGVLQRIALVYLIASLAYLHLGSRSRMLLSVGLLSGYWLTLMLMPVPGYGAGDLSPDGNLAAYVDRLVLGVHVWKYAPGPGDPEGLLSTLPAVVSVLAGHFVGDSLRSSRSGRAKLVGLSLGGGLCLAAGLGLEPWMPLNKNLWTSTYVLHTSGMALLLLALTYAFVDLEGWDRWAKPFYVFGTNSIAAFVGSSLMAKITYVIRWTGADGETVTLQRWLYGLAFASWLPEYVASLAWALMVVAIWGALMSVLYRRGIFIKI